ncbi:magnesium chelatase subunit D family protein [Aeromicrobium sp. P5_D10]
MQYPFSAVLGCQSDALDDMGLALILNAVSPHIGGVLVRGEKGTAKSTTVRAMTGVLPPVEVFAADRFSIDPADAAGASPDGPFASDHPTTVRPARLVELPVGATEDRVLGSIQLERALSHGKVEYEPGLLAAAHRGLLYVDEVNLLHDHLVDVLLDSAAMGRVTVERDGVSLEYASRFVLIGTMNPEEGELRPQLLDRFGLTVEVSAVREPHLRAEVVRRRMSFDLDPAAFVKQFEAADHALTERIDAARARLPFVELTDAALLKIAEVCAAFEVDGLRADIVTARTAVAHAAWNGRDEVAREDIRRAALLALPHRRRRNPFDAPGLDEELLDQILGDEELPPEPPPEPEPEPEPEPSPPGESEDGGDQPDGPSDDSAPAEPQDAPAQQPAPPTSASNESVVSASTPAWRPKALTVRGTGHGAAGRRSRAITSHGRRVGVTQEPSGSLHLVETLMAAAGKQADRQQNGKVALHAEDLRFAVREGRESNLVLFCVDTSGSMAARKRMTEVKTAILALLLDAYRRRDKVGLVTFRGLGAEVALPPTQSVDIAAARLDELPAGGRTPVAEGLLEAARVIRRESLRDPSRRPLLIVVTDGRATGGTDAVARSRQAADEIAALGVTTVVIDSERGPMRLGLAVALAERMGAEYLPVDDVSAETLHQSVQAHIGQPHSGQPHSGQPHSGHERGAA